MSLLAALRSVSNTLVTAISIYAVTFLNSEALVDTAVAYWGASTMLPFIIFGNILNFYSFFSGDIVSYFLALRFPISTL